MASEVTSGNRFPRARAAARAAIEERRENRAQANATRTDVNRTPDTSGSEAVERNPDHERKAVSQLKHFALNRIEARREAKGTPNTNATTDTENDNTFGQAYLEATDKVNKGEGTGTFRDGISTRSIVARQELEIARREGRISDDLFEQASKQIDKYDMKYVDFKGKSHGNFIANCEKEVNQIDASEEAKRLGIGSKNNVDRSSGFINLNEILAENHYRASGELVARLDANGGHQRENVTPVTDEEAEADYQSAMADLEGRSIDTLRSSNTKHVMNSQAEALRAARGPDNVSVRDVDAEDGSKGKYDWSRRAYQELAALKKHVGMSDEMAADLEMLIEGAQNMNISSGVRYDAALKIVNSAEGKKLGLTGSFASDSPVARLNGILSNMFY